MLCMAFNSQIHCQTGAEGKDRKRPAGKGGSFARGCLLFIETGQKVASWFVAHAWQLATAGGYEGCYLVLD